MTTARFCHQCGKDVEGAAFCPYCGAAQAVTTAAALPPTPPTVSTVPVAPAAPLNAFCPNCGTKAAHGIAFCTQCGANLATGVPLAPSQYAQQAAAESKTPIYVGLGAVIVALIIAVVVMSGGGDDKGGSNTSTGGSQSTSSTGSSSSGSAGQAAGPTPQAKGRVAEVPKPRTLPQTNDARELIGPADTAAADAIRASLTSAGLKLTGVDVNVFGVNGTDQKLLVIDVDTAQASSLSSAMSSTADQRKFAQAIVSSPAVKAARISRLAMNLRGKDAQGNYVMGVTMTMTTLDGMAKGTLSDADLQKQVVMKASRK